MPLSAVSRAVILLTLSNVFMTFAWYAHLKNLCMMGAVYFMFRSPA